MPLVLERMTGMRGKASVVITGLVTGLMTVTAAAGSGIGRAA
jgi:hypothetical protein